MSTEPGRTPTILCLINAAAHSRTYFCQLAAHLQRQGYRVVFALDSHLSDVLYAKNQALHENAWYFTDFMRDNLADLPGTEEMAQQSWSSLFSDFDRFLTMAITPPLQPQAPVGYAQIPALLKRFFARIFAQVGPCAVLYEPVSNAFAVAAYQQCRAVGIPFCSLSPSRIPGRIELSTTGALEDHVSVGRLFEQGASGAISASSRQIAAAYIESIDKQVPDYMKTNGLDRISLLGKYFSAAKFAHFARGWRYRQRYAKDCELAFQHGDPVALSMAYVKRAIARRLRLRQVQRFYSTEVKDEPFLLYPLHFHPEASTSVWAPDFVDELSTIKSLAFRLPCDVKLYVKEHPSAVALQPTSFYRQLHDMPNVRLLAPQLPTKQIIRRSRGVVTLTSTAGFEAAVLNKPVVTLGTVFYNYFPNVRNVDNPTQFAAALRWALSYQPLPAETLLEATAAYVEFGVPGKFDFEASRGDASALAGVAALIHRTLQRPVTVAHGSQHG